MVLPPGLKRIESGRDLDGQAVVRVDLEAPLLVASRDRTVAIVGRPRAMRAFAALVLRQADLTEAAERGEFPR